MEWYVYILVIVVGFFVGFINTLAGGGSILSLPLLIFLGLPANVANGTNRIGVLFQSITATGSFSKFKIINIKHALLFAIPSVVGAVIGAMLAVNIDESMLEKAIGVVLLFMFFVILYKPEKWLNGKENLKSSPSFLQIIVFFLMGLYGGFIQLGAGFFYIAAFVLSAGIDIIKANVLKVIIIGFYTLVAIPIFIYNKQVNFELGILLAVGNVIGAFVAAKAAIKWGAKFVQYILLATIIISAIKLFTGI
ncbi:MAG: hypothetical protein A2033_16450 [Bacteroidetes bacterium GWA2_31_9]|nr:MAG: hypothetical protein A2033_16450 [Bacteroidetes bacterium GWA2_31_9]